MLCVATKVHVTGLGCLIGWKIIVFRVDVRGVNCHFGNMNLYYFVMSRARRPQPVCIFDKALASFRHLTCKN